MSTSKLQKVNDTAGAQMWADEVTELVRQAKAVTARSKNNLQYHRDRVSDEKKAREDLLNEYAHLSKIEENCFGGRRIIPRYKTAECCTCGNTQIGGGGGGDEGSVCAVHGRQTIDAMMGGEDGNGHQRTRERNLPELPMSARGVQAAKYRLRERAEKKRFKEEQVMLAREAEKRLRRERLRAAKNRFADDGHVPNVLATFERDMQLQFGSGETEAGGGMSVSPRMTTLKMMASSLDLAGGGQTPTSPSPNSGAARERRKGGGGGGRGLSPDHMNTNTEINTNNSKNNNTIKGTSGRAPLASPQEQKMIITATLLATSGLPPDVLKAGAASVKNLTAATQLLLLTRQHLAVLLETVVHPYLAAITKCYNTRRQHMPEREEGFHDAVEKSFLKALAGAECHERSLTDERVKLEDMVAYLEGLRKAIAGRLPKALTSSTSNSNATSDSTNNNSNNKEGSRANSPRNRSNTNEITNNNDPSSSHAMAINAGGDSTAAPTKFVPSPPLPQVRAEQTQPPSVVNVVALATGKRRRVPVQDTQAAISAADYAYSEAIAVNDAALSLRRSVSKDTVSLVEGLLAALEGKVKDNKKLQRALLEQIASLSVQLKDLDAFINRHDQTGTQQAGGAPTGLTASSTTAPNVAAGGAGVVVSPREKAIGHVREDREKTAKLLDALSENLKSKRALEVVDVEIMRVFETLLEKRAAGGSGSLGAFGRGRSGRKEGFSYNSQEDYRNMRIPLPPPAAARTTGGDGSKGARFEPASTPSARSQLNGFLGAFAEDYAFKYGMVENEKGGPKDSGRNSGRGEVGSGSKKAVPSVVSPRGSSTSSRTREQGRSVAANFGTDVDDLISGRGAVSTRSAKIKAAAPPHQHHYHQQILYHNLEMPDATQ